MFIAKVITNQSQLRRSAIAPFGLVRHFAPTELALILFVIFYKHFIPTGFHAVQNLPRKQDVGSLLHTEVLVFLCVLCG
jgi:hypothetical protein